MTELRHRSITGAIIGAFHDVNHELGHGFSEKLLCRALSIVLRERGFVVIDEPEILVDFHGHRIGSFRADLVVNGKVLVEVKAARELESRHEGQLLNYLKCAGGGVGMLLNFGSSPVHRRFVMGEGPDLPNLLTRDR